MKNILIGMILGVANVIPGVSAGTMAVVFKIYDQLLDSISIDPKKLKKNANFLITLGIGIVAGILLFSKIITFLYENYNIQTNFVFIGVILGSIPMIYKKIVSEKKLEMGGIIPFVIPLIIMLYMAATGEESNTGILIENINITTAILFIFAGAISAFTMIIPGISGSFILLTIGCYETIIASISIVTSLALGLLQGTVSFSNILSSHNLWILILFGFGMVIGLIGGSSLVQALLSNYTQGTYLVILGLVVGSIFTIYPGLPLNFTGISAILFMVVACVVSYMFSET
ncbi:DUF368 domain-containing protein [Candidatus Epulonipiscium viviparus]|uniref:DUF368 domain-containing protein n=1 Tax=Candidatus Epulonipiscium viviparus TaxID=420336 RepID=UPI0027380812|nr:DUF368 domain-containing protein [Candidatus Epulopiscium viviparus]